MACEGCPLIDVCAELNDSQLSEGKAIAGLNLWNGTKLNRALQEKPDGARIEVDGRKCPSPRILWGLWICRGKIIFVEPGQTEQQSMGAE